MCRVPESGANGNFKANHLVCVCILRMTGAKLSTTGPESNKKFTLVLTLGLLQVKPPCNFKESNLFFLNVVQINDKGNHQCIACGHVSITRSTIQK